MPRMRGLSDAVFYRPSKSTRYQHIDALFGDEIDWDLIATHARDMIQVVLSIQAGRVMPSMLLRKLGTYNRKSLLYRAFRELGRVERTLFLLRFISNTEVRRVIRAETTKIEAYNDFLDWVCFGGPVVKSGDPVEQEKQLKYASLVANAVMLSNVADLTEVLSAMAKDGHTVTPALVACTQPLYPRTHPPLRPVRTRHGRSAQPLNPQPLPFEIGLVTTFYTYLQPTPELLPARERGSKRHIRAISIEDVAKLAPRAGARIETISIDRHRSSPLRRSPRGSADRNRFRRRPRLTGYRVAPRAGARIETLTVSITPIAAASLPARERGSKHPTRPAAPPEPTVAPRAGARIETAPRCVAGANAGRSPRGSADRNPMFSMTDRQVFWSLPARERGSKHREPWASQDRAGSLPARERGSKLQKAERRVVRGWSLPARERGSKQPEQSHVDNLQDVAPRAGARIETRRTAPCRWTSSRRSPRGSADRNTSNSFSRSAIARVAPRAGARIETPRRSAHTM